MSRPPQPTPAQQVRFAVGTAIGIAVLVLAEVTLVAFLPTRWAVPDLVTVAVLAVAHHRGPVAGGLTGAWAGAMLDLVPPAGGPLGAWMLVLGSVAAVHGRVVATRRPGPLLSLVLLALAAAAACAAHAGLLWFVGVPVAAPAVARAVLASGLWALLLAPLALLARPRRRSRRRPRRGPLHREDAVSRSVPASVTAGGLTAAHASRPTGGQR